MWTKEQFRQLVGTKQFAVAAASAVSLASGLTGGHLLTKKMLEKKYEEIANQEIEEAKNFYSRIYDKPDLEELAVKYDEAQNIPDDLVEKVAEAAKAFTEYSGVSVTKSDFQEEASGAQEQIEGKVVEMEDHNIFTDSSPAEDSGWNLEEEIEKRQELVEGTPYVIEHDEFYENEKEYEQITLTYFEGDDTLSDARDQPVEDTENTVGDDNLTRFGHGSKDNNIVFVQNDRLETLFEIVRSTGKYAEEVLGFTHSDKPRLRKFRSSDE